MPNAAAAPATTAEAPAKLTAAGGCKGDIFHADQRVQPPARGRRACGEYTQDTG